MASPVCMYSITGRKSSGSGLSVCKFFHCYWCFSHAYCQWLLVKNWCRKIHYYVLCKERLLAVLVSTTMSKLGIVDSFALATKTSRRTVEVWRCYPLYLASVSWRSLVRDIAGNRHVQRLHAVGDLTTSAGDSTAASWSTSVQHDRQTTLLRVVQFPGYMKKLYHGVEMTRGKLVVCHEGTQRNENQRQVYELCTFHSVTSN